MNIHDAMISKQSASAIRGAGSGNRQRTGDDDKGRRLLSRNLIAAVCTFPHVHPTASRSFSSRLFFVISHRPPATQSVVAFVF